MIQMVDEHDLEGIRIVKDFLPDRIFDAHAHLFDTSFVSAIDKALPKSLVLRLENYEEEMRPILCNPKTLRLNIIGYPDGSMDCHTAENLVKSDTFLLQELTKNPENVGELLLAPGESAEELEERLVHPGIRGFKCYHLMAKRKDTWFADIGEYLPESAWEVANKHKMVITLHMVKDDALADPDNQRYICEMAKRFPDATLILAHAARSFASWTGVESVEKVAHLDNVWFDFSAVCESPAMFQIMRKAGVEKCMWGSDYPVCRGRGKAISLANSFYWIYQNDLDHFVSKTTLKSWLIGLENLMATRQACILAELNEDRVEDLFYNNAARLWSK